MFNPEDLAKTLENLQENFKNAQEENKNLTFSAKSGGGLVSVSANGEGEIIDISIDDSLLELFESKKLRCGWRQGSMHSRRESSEKMNWVFWQKAWIYCRKNWWRQRTWSIYGREVREGRCGCPYRWTYREDSQRYSRTYRLQVPHA